jgi:5-hydroxyisourate hydrolase
MSGSLTTAVIDTSGGGPAAGMLIDLFRVDRGPGERHHLKTCETDARGAVEAPLLVDDALVPGTYELLYHVGRYFQAHRAATDNRPFLDVVPVRFSITDPSSAYHVTLLASPWSYTMYRA